MTSKASIVANGGAHSADKILLLRDFMRRRP